MDEVLHRLRLEAARVLRDGGVDVVIGFSTGTVPLKSKPVCIRRPEEAEKLVLNGLCHNNLAVYPAWRPADERIGLVCRGCESRAVRALVVEHQRPREQLFLIGVPCRGILDEKKIVSIAGGDPLWIREAGDQVLIGTAAGDVQASRESLLHPSCAGCRFPDPVGADIVIPPPEHRWNPPGATRPQDPLEGLSEDARYAFFEAEAGRCIRCYACREACPMCYCSRCFVDDTTPRWIDTTVSSAATQAWQLIRAFHQTGRCVACGACERACPMSIRMTYLTDKLNMDMEKNFGFIPGEEENRPPPFAAFTMDDQGRFKFES